MQIFRSVYLLINCPMNTNFKFPKLQLIIVVIFTLNFSLSAQINRRIDGFGNNPKHMEWGAKGTNQLQVTPLGYADGISAPGGLDRPESRDISNLIFQQDELLPDANQLSDYAWVWGQFIDHDITLTPDDASQPMTIPIPAGDAYFDPGNTGKVNLHAFRSAYDPLSGTNINNPRKFPNQITAFIDGSNVYGSDDQRAIKLRTFVDGKLKTSKDNMLPYNTMNAEYDSPVDASAPNMAMANPFLEKWYIAGDVRANENVLLTSMHTIFVREHNRICDQLSLNNPNWTDEEIYQKTRKIVGGIIQAIVYEEWLPALGVILEPYKGYNENINPGIMNIFSTAAYRYGHTVINSTIVRMGNDGNIHPDGNLQLKDAFFNPPMIGESGGVDPLFNGMATQVEQDFDTKMINDLRNFLFGPPGAGGFDLASLNISRGREKGLPDYNTARVAFGLTKRENFEEITSNSELSALLESIYLDIDNIDPWVGFLAEDHMPSTLFGETVMYIMEQQFANLRDGDRYYYENDGGLNFQEREEIKNTRLGDIVKRNTTVEGMQHDVFIAREHTTVATNDISAKEFGISIYPNPGNEDFWINMKSEKSGTGKLQVYNSIGKLVLNKNINILNGENLFELKLTNDILPGLYHLKIDLEQNSINSSFVKSN